MKGPSGRRWLMGALGLFLVLMVLWIAAAMRLSAAAAAPSNLMTSLRSRLSANYAPDPGGSTVRSLRLSIFQEVLQDLGMSSEEAAGQSQDVERQLKTPVPTATARDFEGADPFTATPTVTPVPTETPVPTATPTKTPKPRPTKTKTPVPTVAGPPTSTPSGSLDTTDPLITRLDTNPSLGGPLNACTFQVNDLDVKDLAFSAGVAPADVFAKYDGPQTGGLQRVNIPLESGGFVSGPGSDWVASYDGPVTINSALIGDTIDVWGKVTDLAGRTTIISAGSYTMGVNCP